MARVWRAWACDSRAVAAAYGRLDRAVAQFSQTLYNDAIETRIRCSSGSRISPLRDPCAGHVQARA
eukprot:9063723-Lingulodinium_polyedra.AAC.1